MVTSPLFWILVPLDALLFAAVVIMVALHWPKREEKPTVNWTDRRAWMFVVFGLVSLSMREILSLVEKVAQMRGLIVPTSLLLLDEVPAFIAAVFFVFASITLFKIKMRK